jgi:hypothetical protein
MYRATTRSWPTSASYPAVGRGTTPRPDEGARRSACVTGVPSWARAVAVRPAIVMTSVDTAAAHPRLGDDDVVAVIDMTLDRREVGPEPGTETAALGDLPAGVGGRRRPQTQPLTLDHFAGLLPRAAASSRPRSRGRRGWPEQAGTNEPSANSLTGPTRNTSLPSPVRGPSHRFGSGPVLVVLADVLTRCGRPVDDVHEHVVEAQAIAQRTGSVLIEDDLRRRRILER